MVSRIKVVNDVGELVSIFHAADTDVKRKLLIDLSTGWITLPKIEERYGIEGKRALHYLDKIKMTESQWVTGEGGPEKAYHTYYTNVQINLIGGMEELADIIYATTMSEKKLEEYEAERHETLWPCQGWEKSFRSFQRFPQDVGAFLHILSPRVPIWAVAPSQYLARCLNDGQFESHGH